MRSPFRFSRRNLRRKRSPARRPRRKSDARCFLPRGLVAKTKTPRSPSAHDPLIRGSKNKTIGIIGLGVMGSAMATNLCKAGFRVHGYDPVAGARSGLKKAGGHPEKTAGEVAAVAEVLITSLPS